MAAAPPNTPSGFTNLSTLEVANEGFQSYNVFAIVIDNALTKVTRTGDFMTTFGILDPTNDRDENRRNGFKCRFFDKKQEDVPKVTVCGDVVLIRNIKKKVFNGAPLLLSSFDTKITVFPAAFLYKSVREKHTESFSTRGATPPTQAEHSHAFRLYQWGKDALGLLVPSGDVPPPTAISPAQSRDRFRLLEDVKEGTFVDIVGEVVKLWPGHRATLYFTDYTSNDRFWKYEKTSQSNAGGGVEGDPYGYTTGFSKGWPGPAGKQTIQITLWEPHGAFASEVLHEKDTVEIRNLHIKLTNSGILEGALRTEKEIKIKKLHDFNDKRYLAFHDRRNIYQQKEGLQLEPKQVQKPQPMSKSMKKKQRKAAQKAAQLARQAAQGAQVESSTHVACANPDHPVTPFSYILSEASREYTMKSGEVIILPFVNRRCKIRAKVIDYFPNDLRDFTSDTDDCDYNDKRSTQSSIAVTQDIDMPDADRNTWEWAFFLLVEDAQAPPPAAGQTKPRLRLLVSQKDAEYLLKIDACDLRAKPAALEELKKKLWTLWGDLEEIKEKGETGEKKNSSQPFECWISEYGIPAEDDGWERMFRLMWTTIK